MIVLAIDPGASGAGYAVVDTESTGRCGLIYVGSECPRGMAVDAIVVESGFIGKMGRQAMWGLGFDAGWRLCEARGLAMHGLYTIRPDGPNGWRAALPPKPGCFQKYDGLSGEVIVKRLRVRYQLDEADHSEHAVEACGIAEATAAILARPKAKDRKALKAVKRGLP